jgi:predicted house-cleaning noncanonical NTP pyrophosphatase (MazG superfamily)
MDQMDAEGKLVRDRIPEIIEAAGGHPSTRVLDKAERLPAMLAKLQEESDELRAAASTAEQGEELADVLEVLKAIASELGQPWDEVEIDRCREAGRAGRVRGRDLARALTGWGSMPAAGLVARRRYRSGAIVCNRGRGTPVRRPDGGLGTVPP